MLPNITYTLTVCAERMKQVSVTHFLVAHALLTFALQVRVLIAISLNRALTTPILVRVPHLPLFVRFARSDMSFQSIIKLLRADLLCLTAQKSYVSCTVALRVLKAAFVRRPFLHDLEYFP